jgi:HlyD family secretion protein
MHANSAILRYRSASGGEAGRSAARWLGLLALIAGGLLNHSAPQAARTEAPQTVIVRRGLLRIAVRTPGLIVAGADVTVAARAPGEIVALPVRIGMAVKKGQLLLEVEAGESTRALNRALANQQEAQARHRIAELRLAADQEQYAEQTERLRRGERPSGDTARITTYTLELDRQEIAVRAADRARAENGVAEARANLAGTRLLAPIDGVVTELMADLGETISRAAVEQGRPVMTISDLTHVAILAEIDQTQVSDLQPNLAAQIMIPAFPDRLFEGHISTISPCGQRRENTAVFPVRIEIKGEAGEAGRPGLTALAEIVAVEKPQVLLVDRRAVRRAGTEYVATVLQQGQAKEVKVKVGRSDGDRFEVLDGLREGDRVVLP